MKNTVKILFAVLVMSLVIFSLAAPAFAAEAAPSDTAAAEQTENAASAAQEKTKSTKAIAACAVIAIVAATGAIGMAVSISKSADGIARQPEAAGNIRTSLMLGLVFIETAIIYALIVAILVIFVL